MSTEPNLDSRTESPINPNACKFVIEKIGDYKVVVLLTIDNHFVGVTGVRNTNVD